MTEIRPTLLILKKTSNIARVPAGLQHRKNPIRRKQSPTSPSRTIRLSGDHKTRCHRIMVHLTMPTLLLPHSNCAKLFLTGGHHFIVTYITEQANFHLYLCLQFKIHNQKKEITGMDNTTKNTIHLTKEDFLKKVFNYEKNSEQWKYEGDKPCLIDFYADWCGPCKAIAPVLEELAAEYKDQIYIYKIDTEAEMELAAAFGIRSIPTLLFCPMKEEPQQAMGALPKATLKQAINDILLQKKEVEA